MPLAAEQSAGSGLSIVRASHTTIRHRPAAFIHAAGFVEHQAIAPITLILSLGLRYHAKFRWPGRQYPVKRRCRDA